jgi:hypothetical protein
VFAVFLSDASYTCNACPISFVKAVEIEILMLCQQIYLFSDYLSWPAETISAPLVLLLVCFPGGSSCIDAQFFLWDLFFSDSVLVSKLHWLHCMN